MSWDSAENVAGEAPPGSPVLGFMHLQPQRPGVPAPSCGSRATALTCGFPVLSAGVMKCHTEREDGGTWPVVWLCPRAGPERSIRRGLLPGGQRPRAQQK